ncbi:glycosyltransferase family 2 protein [soil metagenome]
MTTDDPELSVVVPVYNELGNIEQFLAETVPVLESCTSSYEIIFVADPCTDGTEDLVLKCREANPAVKLMRLSRRFGQPTSTLAGIEWARGAAVVVMDCDLQDPPPVVAQMVEQWRAGSAVVLARRRQRDGETIIKKTVAKAGYAFINRFSDVPIPRDTGDFRLLDRRVVDELLTFRESHGFLRGLVALVGFEQTEVLFDRPARFSGKGNYNRNLGSLKIGFNGVVGFSSALLNLSTLLGFISAGLALLTSVAYVILKIAGVHFPIGNPTIVVLILLLGGLQLICLGIMGQYVGRIYEEVKQRPRFIVERGYGFAVEPSGATSEAGRS